MIAFSCCVLLAVVFLLSSSFAVPANALTCSGSSLGAQPSVSDPSSIVTSCTLTGSVSFAVPSMPPVGTAPTLAIAVTASTLASGVMLEIRGSGSAAVLATHGPLQALIQGNAYTNGYVNIFGAFPPRTNITIVGNTGRCAFAVYTNLHTPLIITQLFIAEFSTVTVRNNTFEGVGNLYPRGIAVRSGPTIKHYSALILDENRAIATGATSQGEGIGLCQQAALMVDNRSRYEVTRNTMIIHNPGLWILGIFYEACTTTVSLASTFIVEGNTLQGTGTQLRAIAVDLAAGWPTTVSDASVYAVRDNIVDVTATTRFALLEHNGPLSVGTGSRYTVSNNRAFSRGGAAPSPNYLLGLSQGVGVSGAGSRIEVLGNALECTGSNGRLIQEGATLTVSAGGRFVVRDNALGCGTALFTGGLTAPPAPYGRGPEPTTSAAGYVYACNNSVGGQRVTAYTPAVFSGSGVLIRCHIVTRTGSGAAPTPTPTLSKTVVALSTSPTHSDVSATSTGSAKVSPTHPVARTSTHSEHPTKSLVATPHTETQPSTATIPDVTPTAAKKITTSKSHGLTLTVALPPPPNTTTTTITTTTTMAAPSTPSSSPTTTPMTTSTETTSIASVVSTATTTTASGIAPTTSTGTISSTGTANTTPTAPSFTATPPQATTAGSTTTACANRTLPTLDVLGASIPSNEATALATTVDFAVPPPATVASLTGGPFTVAFDAVLPLIISVPATCTLRATNASPSTVTCTFPTLPQPASSTVLEAAVHAAVEGCPALLRLRLFVPGSEARDAAVVLQAARAVLPAAVLAYVFDPTAAEPAMATAVLLADCAAPVAGGDLARVAKYLLNPLAGVGPTSAGAALAVLVAGVWVVHAAVAVLWARREAAAGRRSFAGALRQAQFPSVPFAVSVAMGPGVAWGCGAAINAGGPAWGAVAVCVLFLVCLPAAAALVVFRGPAHTFIHHAAPASWARRLMRPVGAWYAHDEGSAQATAAPLRWGIAASARPGFRLAPVLAAWLLAVLVAAVAVAPPASASCTARHYALAAVCWIAAVLVAAARPHTVPGVSLLSAAGMASLGATCAAVAAKSQAATFAFVLLCALVTIARTGLMMFAVNTVPKAVEKSTGQVSDIENNENELLTIRDRL